MKNLLKSDFYRLFKSLSFYICTGVSVFLFSLSILIADLTTKMMASQGNIIPFPYKDGLSYGMTVFMNGNTQMIIAIFTAIFVVAEFSHGTMKNAVSKGFSKLQIYFSKLITMTAAAFIIFLVAFITSTITATIVIGSFGSLTGEFSVFMLKTFGIEFLLNTAFTAVLVMVAMIVRNLGGVIAIDIVGVMFFEVVIFNLLELIVRGKVKFSEFSLMFNISSYGINTGAAGSDYLRSVIVGTAFLVIATAFGIFMFKKSDVK